MTVGGQFTTLNGSANPGYGLGMVDATTGRQPADGRQHDRPQRRRGRSGRVADLGRRQRLRLRLHLRWPAAPWRAPSRRAGTAGPCAWVNDCHGDTYSVHPRGGALYAAGHTHYCGNMGGFPQTDPDWTFYRGLAFGTQATGVADRDPYGYASFKGQPTSSLLAWYPSINAGTFTGMNQGPWSVAGNQDYVVMGGEFTRVNNKAQQGLVRFPVAALSPNAPGPDAVQHDLPAQRLLDRGRHGAHQLVDQPGHRQRRADLPRLPRRPAQGRARARAACPRAVLGAVHDGVHRHRPRARVDAPVPGGGHRPGRQHRQLAVDDGHGGGIRRRQCLPRGGAGQRAGRPVAAG